MSDNMNNCFFSNINDIISLLQKSNVSITISHDFISCKDDKGHYFSLSYSNDYLRLVMENNDISSLYDIANILKNKVGIPTVQYSLTYKDSEGFLHPTLEWRFDNQEQYITQIINHPVIDDNCLCSYIKLLNGNEIDNYKKEKTFLKK